MKTVLITGANRGLGLGLVKEFLQEGWHVYAACRHPDRAQSLNQLVVLHKENLQVLELDVSNEESIHQLAKTCENVALDLLINNAGILADPHDGNFGYQIGNVRAVHLLESFKVNTMGPLLVTQALLAALYRAKHSVVVNMSSSLGSISHNDEGSIYGYRASKAALNAISKNLAIELHDKNIAVVALHPGWVKTDMGGSRADLTLEESVRPMKKLIVNLSIKDSGKFLDYTGQELGW